MDAKKKQAERDEPRETYSEERSDRSERSEFDIPEEMESWALDDLSDLVPTTFD